MSDPRSHRPVLLELRQFLVDRFGDGLQIFASSYLEAVVDDVTWVADRNEQAEDLIREIEARGQIATLWQALREELLADLPEFGADIGRLEANWQDEVQIRWGAMKAAAMKASDDAISDLSHDPEVYVSRRAAEGVISEFLDTSHPAMILTGSAGVGKTSLAVDLQRRLSAEGHGALFLAGKWMSTDPVWDQIGAKLEMGERRWLQLLGETAKANDSRMVVIIDGIDEIKSSEGGVKSFAELNAALPELPERVRVLVTATKSAWHRLERRVREDIRKGRYFAPGSQLTLELGPFEDDELEEAWSRYQGKHGIGTTFEGLPAGLRRAVRIPAMMHLLAIAFANEEIPSAELVASSDFFRSYFEAKVGPDEERRLLEGIASLMYESGRTPVDRDAIAAHEALRDLVSEAADSPYAQLLDKDVIRELEEQRPLLPGRVVEYAIQRFGAWVLAVYLAARAAEPDSQVELLTEASTKFATYPPAWDAATMLLTQVAGDDVFVRLAGSEKTEVRELVIEAIAELAVIDPDRTRLLVDRVLQVEWDGARMAHLTALRAAYRAKVANPDLDFEPVFVTIARGANDELRESLHDTLYLIWRHDPDYTLSVLRTLVAQLDRGQVLRFWELPATRRLLELLAQIVITLYTTNPTVALGKQIGEMGHDLIVERLRVAGVLSNSLVQNFVFPVVDRRFSEHIYQGFLVDDPTAIDRVFQLDQQAKEDFRTGIGLLDPAAALAPASDALGRLLAAADSDISSLLGAQALAIHLVGELEAAQPVAEALHSGGDLRTRIWVLTAFLVLLGSTPGEWVPLLEGLTKATIVGEPRVLAGQSGILSGGRIDQILMPMGLAYGKRGIDMPLFEELIRTATEDGDRATAARCVTSLGPIGFFHPLVVRDTMARVWSQMTTDDRPVPGEVIAALVDALTAMRALHPDVVDDLLVDLGDESVEVGVRTAADPAWLRQQVALLGLYNNGVHLAVCNPIMREGLLVPTYAMLIEAPNLALAVKGLTRKGWELVEAHDYRLDSWMGPATGGICR